MTAKKKGSQPVVQIAGNTAILIYDLDEERSAYECAYHGLDWALVSWEFDQFLRGALKYGHKYKTADAALEAARDKLHEIIQEQGVSLEMVE